MLVLSRTRLSVAVLLGLSALLILALTAPANAAGKADEARANAAAGKSAPQHTEDNDNNDGGTRNNVVDNNDNAHPSGKDRSVEHGKSGNQGKAHADPDDDGRGPERTNGGQDQPNGRGGEDKADQDGNNGCGNDDDFEDDNEGHCGGSAAPAKPSTPNKPSNPSTPDEPSKPGKPNKPGKPGKPEKPSKPGKPEKPSKPGKPEKPSKPAKPAKPGKPSKPAKPGKIGICHATGSMTNPYVFINVSEKATKGHGRHEGDVIGADSAADCPSDPTDPTNPVTPDPTRPVTDGEDGEVGGVIIVRPPTGDDDDNDPEIVINRRPTPTEDPEITDAPDAPQGPGRFLASTGSRLVVLASIAALALLMGGGLLGIRRFVPKQ